MPAPEDGDAGPFTVGVEEEYLLLDVSTRLPLPAGDHLVDRAGRGLGDAVHPELQRAQVEVATPVCQSLAEVGDQLGHLRRQVSSLAASAGGVIAAAGTHPSASWRQHGRITPAAPYLRLERDYQQLAREQLICGCHVHVGIADEELAIQVMNRVRPWLPVVLALAGNSPFWVGDDTGYASYRTEIWRRWPMSGTPEVFRDRAEYQRLVDSLLHTGSIDDPARIYWDVRPSARFSTLEFRVTDVCLTVKEAVMVAGLFLGLTRACAEEELAGAPLPRPRQELLRAATWRAARYGLEGDLLDVVDERTRPATELVDALLAFVRPSLEAAREWGGVSEAVATTIAHGTGASRQRAAYARRQSVDDVIDFIVAETLGD